MSAAERREQVLEAAVAEFAARGMAGTSTEDVARRAGISQPYLFRLFPTKKALFLALVERCFQRVRTRSPRPRRTRPATRPLRRWATPTSGCWRTAPCCCSRCRPTPRATTRTSGPPPAPASSSCGPWSERLTGLPFERIVEFFAMGMLMNVAAAMDLPAVDERWTRWCPQ